MINIPTKVLIANIFYAKQADFVDYSELFDYKVTLYNTLTRKEKYVTFNDPKSFYPYNNDRVEETMYEIGKNVFVKENNGILSLHGSFFDDDLINSVNNIYEKDIIKLIDESRDIFKKNNKKSKTYIKTMN